MNTNLRAMQQNAKHFLFYSTIILFGLLALLGVAAILIPFVDAMVRILATTAVLAFLSLFSLNDVIRLESRERSVRIAAIVALVANLFWSVLMILRVWGFFENIGCYDTSLPYDDYYPRTRCNDFNSLLNAITWKIIWMAISISVVATIASTYLSLKDTSAAVWYLKIATIALAFILEFFFYCNVVLEASFDRTVVNMIAILAIIEVSLLIITPILVIVQSNNAKKRQPQKSEAELRAEIEAELRAKIMAEQQEKAKTAEMSTQHIDKSADS